MHDLEKLVSTFVSAVSLIMALVLIVSILHRVDRTSMRNSVLMGAIFAAAVLYTMTDPIDLSSAGIYDMRGLLVGTAVALLGPVVGVMAMVTAVIYRIVIGGNGAGAGVVAIGVAFCGGMVWRLWISPMSVANWKKSLSLGVLISLHAFAILMMPRALWATLFTELVPYIVVSNVLGSFLLYYLLRGELSFNSEAETLHAAASTDHLTGLLNRRGLDRAYPGLAVPGGNEFGRALLYFDVDRFKHINDTYGHGVGDAALQFITRKVATNLRPHDVFARLGGDEFAIVLSNIDPEEAEQIAQRCCGVIDEGGFTHAGEAVPVSISVGAIWMLHHAEIDTILDEADKALYVAKSDGRNNVVFKFGRAGRNVPGPAVPAY